MIGKKGFTLTELLIAATISSILMILAVVEYRKSAAEAYWTQAKAMTDQLADAVQRFELANEQVEFKCDVAMKNESSECPSYFARSGALYEPQVLIACNYVEKGMWDESYFDYYICKNSASGGCSSVCEGAATNALACVVPKCESKLSNNYKNRRYCVFKNGVIEELKFNICGLEAE